MSKLSPTNGLPASHTGGAPLHRHPSDATRAQRRRRQRQLSPPPPRPKPPHEVFAGRLLELAERAPDAQAREEICRVVHNLRLRFNPRASMRRFAAVTPPLPVKAFTEGPADGQGSEEQRRAADFAQELMFLMDVAPDEQSDRELNAVVKGIKLRFTADENSQRLTVLKALESAELLELDIIVELTHLSEERVLAILADFTSPEVGLARETTPDGKRRSGRGGTTRLFGLRH